MDNAEMIRGGLAILVPVAALVLIAAMVPIWLARRLGHDLRARSTNIALSSVAMLIVSGGYFAVLYVIEAPRVAGAIAAEPMAALWHFLWLGLMAGLLWAPVVVLAATLRAGGGR
ncbi:hypothetical protein [Acidimangrovimonas sediminis]|uniref:hypothetical protein n=1 Tax=Acidimangrovimonas sediminis TaxID=2056283 RepID=UPI000C80D88B|nr:hypothetical protein [Acidimangrovimonas sediminis]